MGARVDDVLCRVHFLIRRPADNAREREEKNWGKKNQRGVRSGRQLGRWQMALGSEQDSIYGSARNAAKEKYCVVGQQHQ